MDQKVKEFREQMSKSRPQQSDNRIKYCGATSLGPKADAHCHSGATLAPILSKVIISDWRVTR
jgi:hypothetical protein